MSVDDKNIDKEDEEDEVTKLKKEVTKLKEMIENTLLDVRILISELENPFQYLSKYAGKLPEFDQIESVESVSKDKVEKISLTNKEPNEVDKKMDKVYSTTSKNNSISLEEQNKFHKLARNDTSVPIRFYGFKSSAHIVYERALLVGDFLLKVFGKDTIHRMLHLFYRRGLISSDVYMTMLDVIENLIQGEEFLYIKNKVTPEDYMLALYLLNKINDVDENSIFFILLVLKKSYEQLSSNQPFTSNFSSFLKSLKNSLDQEGDNNV